MSSRRKFRALLKENLKRKQDTVPTLKRHCGKEVPKISKKLSTILELSNSDQIWEKRQDETKVFDPKQSAQGIQKMSIQTHTKAATEMIQIKRKNEEDPHSKHGIHKMMTIQTIARPSTEMNQIKEIIEEDPHSKHVIQKMMTIQTNARPSTEMNQIKVINEEDLHLTHAVQQIMKIQTNARPSTEMNQIKEINEEDPHSKYAMQQIMTVQTNARPSTEMNQIKEIEEDTHSTHAIQQMLTVQTNARATTEMNEIEEINEEDPHSTHAMQQIMTIQTNARPSIEMNQIKETLEEDTHSTHAIQQMLTTQTNARTTTEMNEIEEIIEEDPHSTHAIQQMLTVQTNERETTEMDQIKEINEETTHAIHSIQQITIQTHIRGTTDNNIMNKMTENLNESLSSDFDIDDVDKDPDFCIEGENKRIFPIQSQPFKEIRNENNAHCEYKDCTNEVFAACVIGKCSCFLCHSHFMEDIDEESCKINHRILKNQNTTNVKKCTKKSVVKKSTKIIKCKEVNIKKITKQVKGIEQNQHCDHTSCENAVVSTCFKCGSFVCTDHLDSNTCADHFKSPRSADENQPKKKKHKFKKNKYVEQDSKVTYEQHCEYKDCKNGVVSSCFQCTALLCINHLDSNTCDDHSKKHIDSSEDEDGSTPKRRRMKKETWISSKRKHNRNLGKSYVSVTKKIRIEREMGEPCDICKFNCSNMISHTQRLAIFDEFWQLGNLNKQRVYISSHVEKVLPLYRYSRSKIQKETIRTMNNAYYFNVNQEKVRVCKFFFESTLGINCKVISTALKKCKNGILIDDQRGKHTKHFSVAENLKQSVRNHIDSIPRIDSHYLRAQTTRQYIDGGLSVIQLYRLYVEKQKELGEDFVKYNIYYDIFREYNISFFVPKKDQCDLCVSYDNAETEEEKAVLVEKYNKHQEEKKMSREEKQRDKDSSNPNHVVACFDLQAVLTVPRGDCSAFFYKSRLNSFNLTICEIGQGKNDVFCYLWDETQGCRGANEIGSCLFKFLEKKQRSCEKEIDVVFYSDNCSGQQKNKYIMALYLFVVNKFTNINSITHKFLIKGHTQNEGDSAHSTIEKCVKKALKSGPIYVPSQYSSIIKVAKKTGTPYKVNELGHEDFLDLKKLTNEMIQKLTFGGDSKFANIKILKVEKAMPNSIQIKSSYDPKEKYEIIDINSGVKTRKKEKGSNVDFAKLELKQLYTSRLELSDRKKKDLLSLIEGGQIPTIHKEFYSSICK